MSAGGEGPASHRAPAADWSRGGLGRFPSVPGQSGAV